MKKLYKVGIYCRLSVDDASNSAKAKNYIPADESVSIENQYKLLSKFVMLNGWTEVKSYSDDGYSGQHICASEKNRAVTGAEDLLPLIVWVSVAHLADILKKDGDGATS